MVKGREKSGRFRKVFVKAPGGKTKIHYRRRKPKKAKCSGCGAVLHGMERAIPSKLNKKAKTEKKPERPYGGELCSRCMRKKIKEKAREMKI